MGAILPFAVVLLLAVLLSGLAHRTVLSTAVVFLAAGFLLGPGEFDVLHVAVRDPAVELLAELALFSVLFTDGMKISAREPRVAWGLPGRALIIGLPLTFGLTTTFAHLIAGLPWLESSLVGAALSPTDPVFAAAIVGREEIPAKLRNLLNVESGLNDGFALPVVVLLLAIVTGNGESTGRVLFELALGVALGIVVPWIAIRLERSRFFSAAAAYEPLNAFAIGLLLLGISRVTHANEFLAAFAGGVTVASTSPAVRDSFHAFGELIAQVLKLAALLVFGALASPGFFGDISARGYVFAAIALLATRPLALAVSFAGARLDRREWFTAAWFGPKGFSSVVYGLLILKTAFPLNQETFDLIALVVFASILAHSSTDVLVAKLFAVPEGSDS